MTVTAGKRERTVATVPSLEPQPTTIAPEPATLSRQRSIQASPSYVTTTTVASALPPLAMLDVRSRSSVHALPDHDDASGKREEHGHEEEEETAGEGLVGADP